MAKKKNGGHGRNGGADGGYQETATATTEASPPKRGRKRSAQGDGEGGTTSVFHANGAFEIDCELGKVSIGKDTVGVRVKFKRSDMPLERAEHLLCGAQLAISIREYSDQRQIFGEADPLTAVVDARSFACTSDAIGATLSFNRDDTDVEALSQLAQKNVRVTGNRTGAASVPAAPTRDIEFEDEQPD